MLLSISQVLNISWVTEQRGRGSIRCKVTNLIPEFCNCYWHHLALLCLCFIDICSLWLCYSGLLFMFLCGKWLQLGFYFEGGGIIGNDEEGNEHNLELVPSFTKSCAAYECVQSLFCLQNMSRTFWTWNWHHSVSDIRLQLDNCQLDVSLGKKWCTHRY